MKRNWMVVLGLAVLLGVTGCAQLNEQKRKEDATFDPTQADSHYLLTDETPETKPR